MKVRTDFVTNSSTTSFVIITTGDFKKNDLFELMGVSEQSPLLPLFDALYYSLQESMYPAEEYFDQYKKATGNWLELLQNEFAGEVVERIVKAQRTGHQVFIGKLSSDSNLIESFFCVDSFEVENENTYLNALECVW
jgi:hypothetical protein